MIVTGKIYGSDGALLDATYYIVNQEKLIVSEIGNTEQDGLFAIDILPGEALIVKKAGYNTYQWAAEDLQNDTNLFLYENKSSNLLPMAAAAGFIFLAASANKKKVSGLDSRDIVPVAMIGAGVIGFSLLKKGLEKIGIWDSPDTKSLDNAATQPGSFWNPNFWRTKPAGTAYTNAITQGTADKWAVELYDAFGAFNDCEECAKAVLRRCSTKSNASFLAERFSVKYGYDLLEFLRGGSWPQDRLSDADVNEINTYLNRLPAY